MLETNVFYQSVYKPKKKVLEYLLFAKGDFILNTDQRQKHSNKTRFNAGNVL